ncbi:flippase [Priestia flexa]|uniref:flippase n=1 Tax=Priestia flexa TaxID=86664 RepID=UPI0013D7CF0B|nr:flippase [Priestia flexa]
MLLKNSLFRNTVSLVLLKGTEYILPLLTVPYLLRVLGSSNYGISVFAIAIIQYFVYITNYGFDFTATRKIAVNKYNKQEISRVFWSVITLKSILMLICFFILIVFLLLFDSYYLVFFVAFLNVIGNAIFPIWLFQGLETMKFITISSVTARLILTASVFMFVKESQDYILATLLQSLTYVIAGIISLYIIKKYFDLTFYKPKLTDLKSFIVEGWNIFVSSFLSNVMASSGTVILGIFSTPSIVGIYGAIEKLIKAIIGIFSPFTQALFPYVSQKFNDSYNEGKSFLFKIGTVLITISVIMCLLLVLLGKFIITTLYGMEYSIHAYLFQWFAVWIVFSIINNILGIQFLIVIEKSQLYTTCFLISVIINLSLMILLTPIYDINAIVISILIGEIILSLLLIIVAFNINKKIENRSREQLN